MLEAVPWAFHFYTGLATLWSGFILLGASLNLHYLKQSQGMYHCSRAKTLANVLLLAFGLLRVLFFLVDPELQYCPHSLSDVNPVIPL